MRHFIIELPENKIGDVLRLSLKKVHISYTYDLEYLEQMSKLKGCGRMNHKELCVYKVSGGKIVSEEFFM